VAEVQRADQQAGHDLVAHAQQQRGVEHVVRQRHGGAMAITSRENSDSSMPGRPWVTPSHIAGTPPATCTVAPRRARLVADQRRGKPRTAGAPTACRCRR
jgi:hypothetical protein